MKKLKALKESKVKEKVPFTDYKSGYEHLFESLPMDPNSRPFFLDGLRIISNMVSQENFEKSTILALGTENECLSVSVFETPSEIHGHPKGFNMERLIYGEILSTVYTVVNPIKNTVRAVRTEVVSKSNPELIGSFIHSSKGNAFIHKLKPLRKSALLMFSEDYTSSGNNMQEEVFAEKINLNKSNFTGSKTNNLGDVFLIRDLNSPFRDHYLINLGKSQHRISALGVDHILNNYKGNVTLKLNKETKEEFKNFHKIKMVEGKILLIK